MTTIAKLVRWEWFKLSRRWMPWILLAVLVLFTQLVIWASVAGYQRFAEQSGPTINPSGRLGQGITIDCSGTNPVPPAGLPPSASALVQQACDQWRAAHLQELQQFRNNFTVPGGLTNALNVSQRIGVFLLAILTASVIGTEYGWGTLRSVLAQGPGRWRVLTAKLVLMVLATAAAFLIVMGLAALSCTVAGNLAGKGLAGTATWLEVAKTFGRMGVALLPYTAMAAFLSVLTGSAAAGTAITLAYQFGEDILVAILNALVDWFHYVADYLPTHNINAWVAGGASSERGPFAGLSGGLPSPTHGLIVLLCYTVAFLALAYWIFQRRDVKGPSGG